MHRNREYDYLFKLVIIGNSGVGKSSILLRFADDQFNESYLTTIGVDFRFKTLPIDSKNVKLQIWDTAGQERFRTITNAYYKGADGIVIVYDTTVQQSFDDIDKFWLNEVESYAEKNVELLLLGNKCDMANQKLVDTEKAQEYANRRNMSFFETSAKTSEQVEAAFLSVAKKLMKKRDEQLEAKKQKRRSGKKEKGDNETSTGTQDQQSYATQSSTISQGNQPISLNNKNDQSNKQQQTDACYSKC